MTSKNRKIQKLGRLAQRPGTEAEGIAAREAIKRLTPKTLAVRPLTAREITNTLLLRIPQEFQARVWRRSVGAAFNPAGHMMRYGLPGEADIDGIIGPNGRRLAIEVKAGKDRLSEEQQAFLKMITAMGGIAIVARDVETTLTELRAAVQV